MEIPPVEHAIAVQLCPWNAAAWWGNLHLLSRARGFSSVSTAEAYIAAGQAASALHTMALLQAYQAKVLKQLHEGSSDPGLMQELRTVMDLALQVTKVTARSLGQTISALVVQERHLWLNLADIRESDKQRFLDSPISKAGLFGHTVESLAQFSTAQKRTEMIRQQSLPQRPAAVTTPPPAAARSSPRVPSCCLHLRSSAAQQQPSSWPQLGAGSREAAQPISAPARPMKRQRKRHSWEGRTRGIGFCSSGDGESAPPPVEGQVKNLLFSGAISTQIFKRAVSYFSDSQEGVNGSVWDTVLTPPSLSPFRLTEREHLGYVCNPHSLKEGMETSRRLSCCTTTVRPRHTASAPR